MTARILVVDDIAANRRLLEARLSAEYYEVITAASGPEALEICEDGQCDIVLLDVMMPGMDGFEVCRRLKAGDLTSHLPVVMVTSLDQPADRVKGLDAGADDFVTKPIDEAHLLARVRSLARLKLVIDELRLRAGAAGAPTRFAPPPGAETRGRVLIVEDRASSAEKLVRAIEPIAQATVEANAQEAIFKAAEADYDVMVVSVGLANFDALRLCAQIRALERMRNLPILLIADAEERPRVLRGLELGVNDWLSRPVDRNEFIARVRTQIRQKRYADGLREQVMQSVELALIDQLTGLNNRRYFDLHVTNLVETSRMRRSPLTLCIFDIDHFKRVNDTYGHDAGDDVLKGFAERLKNIVRSGDLLCRLGGEEFVIVMPGVNLAVATRIAERALKAIDGEPFSIRGGTQEIVVTTSIGVAERAGAQRSPELFHAADQALYRAKSEGRNRVVAAAA